MSIRVIRVTLTVRRSLPVFPNKRTIHELVGMSQRCQCTRSLRSSPLRGSKSREAGSRSRGQRWWGGKVSTTSSCVVGVQRMIKRKDHLRAGTLMRRVTSTPPITQ
jgi:hypothetical protein